MARLSLSTQILIGLGLGVAVGLFFGEMVAFLDVIGEGFIQLLQMTVIPYIMVSLIEGLGRLTYQEAKRLALNAGTVLVVIWVLALTVVLLLPIAFPDWRTASFFSTSLLQEPEPVDFVSLYIPANPFQALASGVIPAVVLFSIALALALIGMKNKERIIEALDLLGGALMRVTEFVARLTPIGVFAISASAAGTIGVEAFGQLQVYLVSYAAAALFITFWILPGLVAHLTPLTYREVVSHTKDALITAFAAGNLFIVLPMLSEACKNLLRRHVAHVEATDSSVDVLIPVGFNFPGVGELLALSFILFAGWFVGASLSLTDYPLFLVSGLLSSFGEIIVGMPFMLDLMRIPADMFQLFIVTGVVNDRFGTLAGGMGTLVLALLGALRDERDRRYPLASAAAICSDDRGVYSGDGHSSGRVL